MLSEKFIEKLKQLARQTTWADAAEEDGDEFMIDDYCGGNVDDAFSGGESVGETNLAREILTHLKISWKN